MSSSAAVLQIIDKADSGGAEQQQQPKEHSQKRQTWRWKEFGRCSFHAAARFFIILFLIVAACGNVNGQQRTIGVGRHTLAPDGQSVTLTDGWNVATPGSKPKGYDEYNCPIEIGANGDITVLYTKEGGGKTGCALDLLSKSMDTISFAVKIKDEKGCLIRTSLLDDEKVEYAAVNMVPFIHSVDMDEFQKISTDNGWLETDSIKCKMPEKCLEPGTNNKYRCREFTTYEIGWYIRALTYMVFKTVGEPFGNLYGFQNVLLEGGSEFFPPAMVHIKNEKFEIDRPWSYSGKLEPQCANELKPYPIRSWKIAENADLHDRQLIFFGLLAQNWIRDHIDSEQPNPDSEHPLCNIFVKFSGDEYTLLHNESAPSPTMSTTNESATGNNNTMYIIATTLSSHALMVPQGAIDYTVWIVLGSIVGVAILIIVGILIYCCIIKKRDEESDESSSPLNTLQSTLAKMDSQTGQNRRRKPATAVGPSARTARGRTAATARSASSPIVVPSSLEEFTEISKKTKDISRTKNMRPTQKSKSTKEKKTPASETYEQI